MPITEKKQQLLIDSKIQYPISKSAIINTRTPNKPRTKTAKISGKQTERKDLLNLPGSSIDLITDPSDSKQSEKYSK